MSKANFTNNQLVEIVDKIITQETEFSIEEFTGGYISVSSIYKNTQQNYKLALFFGYKNNKSTTRLISIKSETYLIWARALQAKIMSLKTDTDGISLDDILSMSSDRADTTPSSRGSNNSTTIPTTTNQLTTNQLTTNKETSLKIAHFLFKNIVALNPSFKAQNLNNWADDIDKAMRLDGRTQEQLVDCIKWIYSNKGVFWQKNILSGKKLREKFDTMNMQVITKEPTKEEKKELKGNQLIINAMRKRGHTDEEIKQELGL